MIMKRRIHPFFFILLFLLSVLMTACAAKPTTENTIDGWAILVEKDFYGGDGTEDFSGDYINITRMRRVLEDAGWNPEHIHDLREFDRETLQAELDWLEDNADEDDIAILYISSHAEYLGGPASWFTSLADEWEQNPSQRKLLIISTCKAARFTNSVADDPSPHLSIAAVAENELGWYGNEEEGLPIIGSVFTYYFTDALQNPDADADQNGLVSVQEAVLMAEEQQRAYMHDVVLTVPEFLNLFHENDKYPDRDPGYPHVVMDDAIGEPLYLSLDN
jgi:hypothetical protein